MLVSINNNTQQSELTAEEYNVMYRITILIAR
jgi:hypothetical protein